MSLSSLYQPWIEALVGTVPDESKATCGECPLIRRDTVGRDEIRFDSTTKCCTYLPELPNYLVGLALADEDQGMAWGRETIVERIDRRSGVTPLGLRMTPFFGFIYEEAASAPPGAFGRSPGLRCPHYNEERGLCGIWKHRNSVCATWFCRHDRGKVGYAFWMAVKRLLKELEQDLALWCALELGLKGRALQETLADLQMPHKERVSRELVAGAEAAEGEGMWGQWYEKESDFYQGCGRLVASLNWESVRAICGSRIRAIETDVKERYRELGDSALPELIQLGSFRVLGTRDSSASLYSYSQTDVLTVSTHLVGELVRTGAGRSVAQFVETGVAPALIGELVDHGVLVEATGESNPDGVAT